MTYSTSNTSLYNGFEVSANARFNKAIVFGGVTTERTGSLNCDIRDNPNSFRFCDNIPPFRTTMKGSVAYRLPYDVQVSGSFLARPGSSVAANYTVTSAIAGRTVIGSTAGTPSIAVNLIEPNTLFLEYQNQLDARVGKTFRFGRFRAQGFLDVFNVLNASTVTSVNQTYGSNPATRTWMNPVTILGGRFFRFGTQWEF